MVGNDTYYITVALTRIKRNLLYLTAIQCMDETGECPGPYDGDSNASSS